MRGVKISSGARSMIKAVFDAIRDLAQEPVGAASWDRILTLPTATTSSLTSSIWGSQGLEYIENSRPRRDGPCPGETVLLKTLWLIEHSTRIPRTEGNLARLLAESTECDVVSEQ